MTRSKRTILFVTGTRAEFGLLLPVMRAASAEGRLRVRVAVTGMHLATGTWRDVEAAGLAIDVKASMQRRGRTGREADVAALGRGVAGLGAAMARMRPDVVVVLGDRIEALAGALAGAVGGVHVAHLHGGDRAEGVADESMRHAISKLAHLHLAASAQSRARLVRMGEDARWVWNTGSPAMDGLAAVTPAADAPDVIVMQHPIGASDAHEKRWMAGTLAATAGLRRLVMMPNGDPGCGGIRAAIRAAKVQAVEHLPRPRFLELLAGCGVLVGNSSAGMVEAAGLRVPVVNIGPRQGGRERAGNVVDCDYGEAAVRAAMGKARRIDRARLRHPFGDGRAGERIAALLAAVDLTAVSLRKRNAY